MQSMVLKYIVDIKTNIHFTFAEDTDDLQDADFSDYTNNALENLMRVAQKWVNYLTC